jgi:hypothetical protein
MLLPIAIDEKKIFSLFQTLELHEIIFKHLKTQKTFYFIVVKYFFLNICIFQDWCYLLVLINYQNSKFTN